MSMWLDFDGHEDAWVFRETEGFQILSFKMQGDRLLQVLKCFIHGLSLSHHGK